MRSQFARTILDVGLSDPRLTVLVGDIGAFGLRDFARQCPGRFFNIGIREQAMTGAAAGMALAGFIPVVHSITPFVVERCFEQIKDDFGYHRLNGNIVSVGGGIDYAALGCTHHSYSDIAMLRSIPGSRVFSLGSPIEVDTLFREAYAVPGTLNYFRLGGRPHGFPIEASDLKIGRGIKIRDGRHVSLATMGPLLGFACQAADELAVRDVSAEILYFPTVKPFDRELLRSSAEKTRRIVIIEDHSGNGGLADEVRQAIEGSETSVRIKALGIQDQFLRDYGSFDHLAGVAGIDAPAILRAVAGLGLP